MEAPRLLAVQARKSFSNIGWREDEALDDVAAHRAQDIGLREGLDGLGDDLAADALDQLDDGLDDDPRFLALFDVRDQRRVELDTVERQ